MAGAVATAKALQAREATGVRSGGYEQAFLAQNGGSIGSVARDTGANFAATVRNNAQLPRPATIPNNTVVLAPLPRPASIGDKTAGLVQAAEAKDRARAPSDAEWANVSSSYASDLSGRMRNPQGADLETMKSAAGREVAQFNRWAMSTPEAAAHLKTAGDTALERATAQATQQALPGQAPNNSAAAQGSLAGAAKPGDPIPATAQNSANRTPANTNDVTRELQTASNALPATATPFERAAAAEAQTANLLKIGPQDDAYRASVNAAHDQFFIGDPANRVTQAYGAGGAGAADRAAAVLDQETSVGGARYAGPILAASKATLDKITADIGRSVTDLAPGAAPNSDLVAAYRHMATAVDGAARSADGRPAVEATASSLAAAMPANLPGGFGALQDQVTDGGTVLAIAGAGAAQKQGRPDQAAATAASAARTIDRSVAATKGAADRWSQDTQDVRALQGDMNPLLTPDQSSRATMAFFGRNPDKAKLFDDATRNLAERGNDAWQAVGGTVLGYGSDLAGIAAPGVRDAAAALLDAKNAAINDPATLAAMSQGGQMNRDVTAMTDAAVASKGQTLLQPTSHVSVEGAENYLGPIVRDSKVASSAFAGDVLKRGDLEKGFPLVNNVWATLAFGAGIPEQLRSYARDGNLHHLWNAALMFFGATKGTMSLVGTAKPQNPTGARISAFTKNTLEKGRLLKGMDFGWKLGFTTSAAWDAKEAFAKGDYAHGAAFTGTTLGWAILSRATLTDLVKKPNPLRPLARLDKAVPSLDQVFGSIAKYAGPLEQAVKSLGSYGYFLGGIIGVGTTAYTQIDDWISQNRKADEYDRARSDYLRDSGAPVSPQTVDLLSERKGTGGGGVAPFYATLGKQLGASGPQMLAYMDRHPDAIAKFNMFAGDADMNPDGGAQKEPVSFDLQGLGHYMANNEGVGGLGDELLKQTPGDRP